MNSEFIVIHSDVAVGNGKIIPIDELIFFRGVQITNQIKYIEMILK